MLTQLTKEQEAALSTYVRRGIQDGLDTSPADPAFVADYIPRVYRELLGRTPPPNDKILLVPSPRAAWDMITSLYALPPKTPFVWPYFAGSFDSYLFAYYDYFFDVLTVPNPVPKLYQLYKGVLHLGLIFPLADHCIVTAKPSQICTDSSMRLHAEGQKALTYPDGWGIYALYGERVPRKLSHFATDAVDKIPPKDVLAIKNAALRAAVIRRLGLHRFKDVLKMHEVSRCSSGILYDIDLGGGNIVRGLLLTWETKDGQREEIIQGVPTTQTELAAFNPALADANLNDAESMRRLLLGFSLSDILDFEV